MRFFEENNPANGLNDMGSDSENVDVESDVSLFFREEY